MSPFWTLLLGMLAVYLIKSKTLEALLYILTAPAPSSSSSSSSGAQVPQPAAGSAAP